MPPRCAVRWCGSDQPPWRACERSIAWPQVGFGTIGKRVGQFYWVHEMHCVSENEIYTGEAQNWRVQRVTMKPAPRAATAAK